jgi:hypothetical protein
MNPDWPEVYKPFASFWNGALLRIHESRKLAQDDADDCLQRRTADVQRVLPKGQPCVTCENKDHNNERHWPEHIGVFTIEPWVQPKDERPRAPPEPAADTLPPAETGPAPEQWAERPGAELEAPHGLAVVASSVPPDAVAASPPSKKTKKESKS